MSAATLRPRSQVAGGLPRASNATVVSLASLALVAATAWSVMSAAWVDGTSAMLLTAVAAVLEASLIARSSVGRLIALLLLPVVGCIVVVPLTYGSMPGADSATFGDAVHQYANALVTGLFVTGDWPFLVGLCGVFWLIGSWTGWLAVRERRGVLAVLPCYAVLAVNALNAPSLDHVFVPEAAALALSLVVIGRVHLLDLAATWRRSGVVALPGTERRFGRVTWAAAILLLIAAVVMPPVSTHDVSGFFFRVSSGGHGGSGGNGHGGTGNGSPGTVRFDPAAIPGGPLLSQPVTVLNYTTTSAAGVYLRVVNDNYFSEGNWYPSGGTPGQQEASVPSAAGSILRDREPADGGVAKNASLQRVSARFALNGPATGDGAPLGIFLGEPDAISNDGTATGLLQDPLSGLLTVDQFRMVGATDGFVSTGTVSIASAGQLRAAGTAYPEWVRSGYLDLGAISPSEQGQVEYLRILAQQWTSGQVDPYDAASSIEAHLRDTSVFMYTLKPAKTRPSLWPIVDFLQRTHQGYCQYFADSMGALLRADGIPARLVSGYGPGTPDDARSHGSLTYHTVTTSDAHVWVEAYFPHYGWVPFEPTPDGTYDPIQRGVEPGAFPPAPKPTPNAAATPTPKPAPTPRPPEAAGAGGNTGPTIPPAMIAVMLVLLMLIGAGFAARNWLATPRTLPGMWTRLAIFGAALGVRRKPSETYHAYVQRLSTALPPDTTTLGHREGDAEIGPRPLRARVVGALEFLASSSGKAEFSEAGLDERERVQWRRAWDRVRRAMPLLLWRNVLARSARRTETS